MTTDSQLVVFDTNTLISAVLASTSKPAMAFQQAQRTGFLACSDVVFAELCDVLMRPKFDKYVSRSSRQQFLTAYQNAVLWVDVVHTATICRDLKDNKFLDLAVSAGAAYLISGDADLRVLRSYEGVQIVSPADFLVNQ